ncbi:MAG: Oxidoreductase [Halothiobacillaceae bacterium]|nr:MAG: Oxidoreductase [Halothiobacillaceae bacterium]
MQIIKERQIVDDHWHFVAPEVDSASPPAGDIVVTLSQWQRWREPLLARRAGALGVRLLGSDDLQPIVADLHHFALIALEFPTFRDGRAYSSARLLRDRYGYTGELRAIGDVLRDQLYYMSRVGFNAFALRADQDIHHALQAFAEISVRYQASHDEPRPLYRRR